MQSTDTHYIKNLGGRNTEKWNNVKYLYTAEINQCKYEQNEDLCLKLVQTGTKKLIEGTTIDEWGGGRPFSSPDYENGKWTGNNRGEKILEDTRHNIVRAISEGRLRVKGR